MNFSILRLVSIFLAFSLLMGVAVQSVYAKGAPIVVGSKKLKNCGTNIDSKSLTFETKDYWHGLAQCMRNLRDIWSKRGPASLITLDDQKVTVRELVRRQVVFALNQPYVVFFDKDEVRPSDGQLFRQVINSQLDFSPDVDRVALTNKRGVPYNGMGQSGLSYFLYQFSFLSEKINDEQGKRDSVFYRKVANFSINTVLTETDAGGLATSSKCGNNAQETCVWFHSVTRRDLETKAGATLNQDLHVIRDLGSISDLLRKNGTKEDDAMISRLDAAVSAGINQLFISEGRRNKKYNSPNFSDFLSPSVGFGQVNWLFYGINLAAENKAGYFLGREGKDCAYHMHVLDLLDSILQRAQGKGTLSDQYKSCSIPLASAYRTISVVSSSVGDKAVWAANDKRDYQCSYFSKKKNWNPNFLTKLYKSCDLNGNFEKAR